MGHKVLLVDDVADLRFLLRVVSNNRSRLAQITLTATQIALPDDVSRCRTENFVRLRSTKCFVPGARNFVHAA